MKTILAMGQSNAVGWGAGGAWGIPASVTVWNCTGHTDTGFVGNAFVAPVYGAAPFTAGHNNMMVHACRYLSAELGEDVRLILVAFGGQTIQAWSNTGGTMYARMVAVLAAAGVTAVDALLWHQGEANEATYSTYAAAWSTLLGKLTTDGIIGDETPIVIGELANVGDSANMNAVLRLIADASPRVGLADIATFVGIDQAVHFTGQALVRCGLEYARELLKLFDFAPEEDGFPYVTAAGISAYTPTANVNTPILVKAENGKKSLIQSGAFVADRLGVWEFDVSAISFTSSLNIMLLDSTNAPIQYILGSTASSHFDGSSVLALGAGDKVSLGIVQSLTASAVSQGYSALLNRLTVKYLGRD